MVANDKKMKALLLDFLNKKPQNKKTITFITSDLYLTPRKSGPTKEIKSARRRLAKWIFDSIEADDAIVGNYKISIYRKIIPYIYVATKIKGVHNDNG